MIQLWAHFMPQASKSFHAGQLAWLYRLRRLSFHPTESTARFAPSQAPLAWRVAPRQLLIGVLIYLGLGLSWILLTNAALQAVTDDPELYHDLQTTRDILSLLLSGLVLLLILARTGRRLQAMTLPQGALIERALEGICLVRAGRLQQLNPALLELLGGTSPRSLAEAAVFELFVPEERVRLRSHYQNLRAGDEEILDTKLLDNHGRHLGVRLSMSRLWMDQQTLDLFLINPLSDAQMQQEADFEHAFLLSLFETFPQPLIARAHLRDLQWCNRAMRHHLGLPLQALPSDHVGLPLQHPDAPYLLAAFEAARTAGDPVTACEGLRMTAITDAAGGRLGALLWLSSAPDDSQQMRTLAARCAYLQIRLDCQAMAQDYPGLEPMAQRLLGALTELPWAGQWTALMMMDAAQRRLRLFQWQCQIQSLRCEEHPLHERPAPSAQVAGYDFDHLDCGMIPAALRDALQAAAVEHYVQLPVPVDEMHCAALLIAHPKAELAVIDEQWQALREPLRRLLAKAWQEESRQRATPSSA